MEIPALAEDRDDRGSGVDQLADVAVFFNGVFREARGPEGGQLCVLQFQTARLFEELFVFGIGAGPSAFNVIDTELIEFPGNEHFVIDGEGDGFALRAVPKSGIEGLNAHGWLVERSVGLRCGTPTSLFRLRNVIILRSSRPTFSTG